VEADPAALGRLRRRGHELADGVEHHPELGVVLRLQGSSLRARSAWAASSCRIRTNARMISTLTRTARSLRRTLDSMATPCSVKA
jgi:hypothetical protein